MGEKHNEPFQFTFNGFLKVAFQGSRVTSDAGLILIRELDERLGVEALIAEHLRDSRQGLNTQFGVADKRLYFPARDTGEDRSEEPRLRRVVPVRTEPDADHRRGRPS